ncbi:MAG: J domain-containing protein [Sphingomonas sp.]|uniref:J domain-containing protein n=1 Tax=Sphingomonas sp. TaxID=28214 RepID=UPI0026008014|nr:J domain-containing protein [Sphingomonas sp.]MBX3565844.1 J domain-containing protein [Sphingomonas sp.]
MAKMLLAAAIVAAIYYMFIRPRPKPAMKPQRSLGEEEARAILGVAPDADAEAIRAAHRRLVTALHPDKGGSAELTRRINTARDTLLG